MSDWLPLTRVCTWLKVDPNGDRATNVVDPARKAAADYVEGVRPDLYDDQDVFQATPRIVQAGVLATARLVDRQGSPMGVQTYAELGTSEILRLDPDVARLLGTTRDQAVPRIG